MMAMLAIARVELTRLLRSQIAFTLLLLAPAMQVLLFGYAIRPAGAPLTVALAAAAPSDARGLADLLQREPAFRLLGPAGAPGTAAAAVAMGTALIGIEIPAQRRADDPLGPAAPIRVSVDASNAALAANAAPALEAVYWRALAESAGLSEAVPGLVIERRYNRDARADWTFMPALIGVTVMIGMLMLGTLSLAREREGGTWEALLILPIRPSLALAGKLLPYVVIGTLQGLTVLGAARWLFGVPARGNIGALIALLPAFSAAHLVLGYAISARARTQLAALQGAVAFYLPALLLSGFLYPFESLPGWAQAIGDLFPLTHFIRAARGAMLRGEDGLSILKEGLPILAFLAAAIAAALALQTRRLD